MWQQYRKTWIPAQIAIVTLILFLYFAFKANFPTIIAAAITMELGSLFGAIWSRRLQRKIDAARNKPRLGH